MCQVFVLNAAKPGETVASEVLGTGALEATFQESTGRR